MPDYRLGRCDGHHEMADFGLRKKVETRAVIACQVVGEILNTCSEPTGVQLQFTFRDDDGKVIEVKEMWPASTRNIAPNTSYPFSFPVAITGRPTRNSVARSMAPRAV
jgi:hypothetical protein